MIGWLILLGCFLLALFLVGFHLPTLQRKRRLQLATSISVAIENRGPFLGGITQETADLSVQVGSLLGLERAKLAELRTAALLCDLGLTSIPSAVLLKKNEWSPEEQSVYDRHPKIGASILRQIKMLSPYAKVVEYHHERYEAKVGLPVNARILSATSDYVRYARSMSSERALLAIERQSGLHYDPAVVDAMKAIVGVS